jgi:hypothetical protein
MPLPTPREAREAAGYAGPDGLARLAREVGRAITTIQLVERGYRPPELLARRLVYRLRCDPKVFLQPAPGGRNYNKRKVGRSKLDQVSRRS